MQKKQTLTEQHNLISETKFRLKSALFIGGRGLNNLFSGLHKYRGRQQLINQPVIAVSDSELWNLDDNELNWILTAGKVENLRLAAKHINGLEVPANQIFSFWKHIGNPNIGKGYVIGREIREGCIVPTIAGGLCQLSNALYDAALKASFEIIERHKHTRVIKGSLAEQDRDATVKWNYVDLRFRSPYAFRIEVDLTADRLIVKLKADKKEGQAPADAAMPRQFSKLNDCYSCGNYQCFKHPGSIPAQKQKEITTYILDDKWPEFDTYLQTISSPSDIFIIPLLNNKFINATRYNWTIKNSSNVRPLTIAAIKRLMLMKWYAHSKSNIFSSMLKTDERIAKAAVRKIPLECTHLVITQNLLPFLWREGALGGRTFDVLMTRLPVEKLQERLNMAYTRFPESATLNDFRASQAFIDLENTALTKSRNIITPHQEIADIFNNKVIKLDWVLPTISATQVTANNKILFPASSLGRKGAYEVRQLAKELGLTIIITGKATEHKDFWESVNTEFTQDNIFGQISLVVYPAYAEHQPRLLLKAIAAGLPVIASAACGLTAETNVKVIPIGDYNALKKAVEAHFTNVAKIQPCQLI